MQAFGKLLRNHALATSAIGREEFAVFLPSTPADVALSFAQTLQKATTTFEDLPVTPTASFGVASLASAPELQDAFRRADMGFMRGRTRVDIG
ncbi:diguanylate cyclase domain-containing protein [Rhizobium halophilum]|uniref:diguanylate cyclase domain-containing protein n=1 Tax=Rhizobium halophilum TaxID=2846852 RepID=UPI00374CAA1B